MLARKVIAMAAAFSLLVSPVSAPVQAEETTTHRSINELIQTIQLEYSQYEDTEFNVYHMLEELPEHIPDKRLVLDFVDTKEYALDYQEVISTPTMMEPTAEPEVEPATQTEAQPAPDPAADATEPISETEAQQAQVPDTDATGPATQTEAQPAPASASDATEPTLETEAQLPPISATDAAEPTSETKDQPAPAPATDATGPDTMQPANEKGFVEMDDSNDSGDASESGGGVVVAGDFTFYYRQYLALYASAQTADFVGEHRFSGTSFSRIKLDMYRLLHVYLSTYQDELTEEQYAWVALSMGRLLTLEVKQAEAAKNDLNSYMTYLEAKLTDKQKLPPPSESHTEVANQHFDNALSHMEKSIVISPFVLLHNSLRKSTGVLEMFGMNYTVENLNKDTDLDKISDINENKYNTDPQVWDTDHDGLSDGFELSYKLDPLLTDTDENGVPDNLDNLDEDALTNVEEQTLVTKPDTTDSDNDGWIDSDEVNTYHTDPMKFDTDDDGISDPREGELGLDPLRADTNNDGVPDGDSTVTESAPLDEERLAEFQSIGVIPSVTVTGRRDAGSLTVINDAIHYNTFMQDIPGMIGHPVEFSTPVDFEKATLSFQVTEAAGSVDLDNLRIMWWDEKNQKMVLLPNQQVNRSTRTISADTTHFSRYLVVDYPRWKASMDEPFDAGKPTVIRGRINEFSIGTTYLYRNGSMFNNGIVDREPLETIRDVNKDLAHHQAFFFEETQQNFISNAVNRLVNDASLKDKWKVLLVASDTKKVNDANLPAALEKAIAHQIKIFTFWTSDDEGSGEWDLEEIAQQTDGKFYVNDLQEIATSVDIYQDALQAVLDEEDADLDGIPDLVERNGIRIGTGQKIFPSTAVTDADGNGIPDGQDSDKDGVIDGYELGYTDYHGVALPVVKTPADVRPYAPQDVIAASYPFAARAMMLPPRGDYDSVGYESDPWHQDTDSDDYNDAIDRYPNRYYQPALIMLHGVNSNSFNVFGAPSIIAHDEDGENAIIGSSISKYRNYLLNLENQRINPNRYTVQKDGLYNQLRYSRDALGRERYQGGFNMFVFNYPNLARYNLSSPLLNDYLKSLWSANKIEDPTRDDGPLQFKAKVDIIVHSMGGLVSRYYNEVLEDSKKLGINRLIFLATPHEGGENADTVCTARIVCDIADAGLGLQFQYKVTVDMNDNLMSETWRKHGARYIAFAGVNWSKLDMDENGYADRYLPSSLQQKPPYDRTYEYQTYNGVHDYIEQSKQIIRNAGLEPPLMNDGWVNLNSGLGYYPDDWWWPPYYRSEHWLPFDTRIGYIGMSEVIDSKGLRYEGTDHSGIHHNKKVINSVKYILNN